MTCELILSVNELYSAYDALIERCCIGLSSLEQDECVTDAIWTVYNAVTNLFSSPSCSTLTAAEDAPDPGDPEGCLTAEWLAACLAWIEGITCDTCEDPWEWEDTAENGPTITHPDQTDSVKAVLIEFEDSAGTWNPVLEIMEGDCGDAANGLAQNASSECCFIAGADGTLRVAFLGRIEDENEGYDSVRVIVRSAAATLLDHTIASVGNGSGCTMATPSASYDLAIVEGTAYWIEVRATTGDGNFHEGAYWRVTFTIM